MNTDVFAWYNKYVEVLVNIGWQVRDLDFRIQAEITQNVDMHKAIIRSSPPPSGRPPRRRQSSFRSSRG